jgi:hypothetical protein
MAQPQHEQGTEQLSGSSHELGQVGAGIHQPVDQGKDALGAALRDQREQLGIELVSDQAENLAHPRGADGALAEAQTLVQHGESVPHAPVRLPGDERQGVVVRRDPFGVDHLAQPRSDAGQSDAPEVETLQAGEHRCGGSCDFLGLGRGEDEHYVWRRLLENL